MIDNKALMKHIYAAFNRRDIDSTLALMSETVDWPKSSEGGRVIGKDEIRAYWTRQWAEFNPHVEPIEVVERPDGKTDVKVRQLVKDLNGVILSDQDVWHIYTIENGLIARLDVNESTPSFAKND
ncbi:nuclear transport factor 2 family protein [soil metagenome]